MIGSTIETDLIGELLEVHQPYREMDEHRAYRVIARGRCRAATVDPQGDLYLWIEIVDAAALAGFGSALGFGSNDWQIGDVYRVTIGNAMRLRLLRGVS